MNSLLQNIDFKDFSQRFSIRGDSFITSTKKVLKPPLVASGLCKAKLVLARPILFLLNFILINFQGYLIIWPLLQPNNTKQQQTKIPTKNYEQLMVDGKENPWAKSWHSKFSHHCPEKYFAFHLVFGSIWRSCSVPYNQIHNGEWTGSGMSKDMR